MHICRRWRRIVFVSQQFLHLQLFCTPRTPVLNPLGCWPATLPIVVQYGGSIALEPPGPKDEDNIMTALMQSGRVSSISLTVTSSLLNKLSAIERPFLELENLVLLSRDGLPPILPIAFLWGPRLRRLHLTGVTFPPLRLLQLLYFSRNIVDLQLHEVVDPQILSPRILKNALSRMSQLRSLSLHFLFATDHIGVLLASTKRVVLPALTRLNFRGIADYLEDLVARIDAPRLGDIEVTIFNESFFELSKLSEFINRTEMHKSHRRADILLSEHAFSISMTQPGASTYITLQLFCESLPTQLFFLNRICIHFSAFLFKVEDLCIRTAGQSLATWGGSGPWLRPLNPFTCVKQFHVIGSNSTNIVRALQLPDRWRQKVLPALHKHLIPQLGPHMREAVVSLMVSRRLSGHPITVEYEPLYHISEPGGIGTMSAQCHHYHSLTRLK